MKLRDIILRSGIRTPLIGLVFGSVTCAALTAGRMLWTGNKYYACFAWNLFLAALPLAFALAVWWFDDRGKRRDWRTQAAAGAWLLFFPNAPYICTDLVHLPPPWYPQYWVDLVLILLYALTGLMFGFLSLFLLQSLVARHWGRIAGWLFVGVASGLSGYGVYLGRILRFNSWDLVTQPRRLYQGITGLATNPPTEPSLVAFPVLFALLVFVSYLMLYGLTHLPPPGEGQTSNPNGPAA